MTHTTEHTGQMRQHTRHTPVSGVASEGLWLCMRVTERTGAIAACTRHMYATPEGDYRHFHKLHIWASLFVAVPP